MRTTLLALGLLCALGVRAELPRTLGYQGHLTTAAGQPVNGTVEMTLRLYQAEVGGVALWTETHAAVSVSNGAFAVRLGSATPLDLPFDQPYYLGISVGADAEMSSRLPIGAVPYALRARSAEAAAPGSVTAQAIQDASITPDRLGDFCDPGRVLVRSAEGWQCGVLP